MSYTHEKYGIDPNPPKNEKKLCDAHNFIEILNKIMCSKCGEKRLPSKNQSDSDVRKTHVEK